MTDPLLAQVETAAASMALPPFGIAGRTGRPAMPALDFDAVVARALGERSATAGPAARLGGANRGLMPNVDPDDLASAGWAAVLAADADARLEAALAPLLAHRERQAARLRSGRFRVLAGVEGYRRGDAAHHFLMRQGAGFGPVDPDQLPYYLLLVGGPEAIPFEVEHQLGVQYAVGRLAFDRTEGYARYAESVVEAELGPVPVRPRSLAVVGVTHPGDSATETLRRRLLEPAAERVRSRNRGCGDAGWRVATHFERAADKRGLRSLLGAADTPGVLLAGCHGLAFDADDPLQRERHGALLCSDWTGPARRHAGSVDTGGVSPECYVAASDVEDRAELFGLVAFLIACYGAGVPEFDRFGHRDAADPSAPFAPRRLSATPFVGRLPQRLLAHPRGAAAAVIGHVDRAWGYGWAWARRGEQNQTVMAAIDEILAGRRLGHAMRFFGERYAELSAALASLLEAAQTGPAPPALELVRLWTARNDARGWVLLGDPAARAATGGGRGGG